MKKRSTAAKRKSTEKICVRDPRTKKLECYVPGRAKTKRRGTGGTSDCGCGG